MIAPWGYLSHVPGYMSGPHYPTLPTPYPFLYPWLHCTDSSGPPWRTYPMMPPNQPNYKIKSSKRETNPKDPWVQVCQELELEDTGDN